MTQQDLDDLDNALKDLLGEIPQQDPIWQGNPAAERMYSAPITDSPLSPRRSSGVPSTSPASAQGAPYGSPQKVGSREGPPPTRAPNNNNGSVRPMNSPTVQRHPMKKSTGVPVLPVLPIKGTPPPGRGSPIPRPNPHPNPNPQRPPNPHHNPHPNPYPNPHPNPQPNNNQSVHPTQPTQPQTRATPAQIVSSREGASPKSTIRPPTNTQPPPTRSVVHPPSPVVPPPSAVPSQNAPPSHNAPPTYPPPYSMSPPPYNASPPPYSSVHNNSYTNPPPYPSPSTAPTPKPAPTSTIVTPSIVSIDAPTTGYLCNRCETTAVLRCAPCNSYLCRECSDELHSKGKWKTHAVRELNSAASDSSVSSQNFMASEAPTASYQETAETTYEQPPRDEYQSTQTETPDSYNALTTAEPSAVEVATEQYISPKNDEILSPVLSPRDGHDPDPEGKSGWGQIQTRKGPRTDLVGRARSIQFDPQLVETALEREAQNQNPPPVPSDKPSRPLIQPVAPHPQPPAPAPIHGLSASAPIHGPPAVSGNRPASNIGIPAKKPLPPKLNTNAKSLSVSELRNKIGGNIMGALKPSPSLGEVPKAAPPGAIAILPRAQHRAGAPINPQEAGAQLLQKNGRFIMLCISVPEKDIRDVPLVFSLFCTVKQVIGWCTKQLCNEPYTEKREKGKDYWNLCRQGQFNFLDIEKTLFSHGFKNREPLELRRQKCEQVLMKAQIPQAQSTYITLKVDETTSVWQILQNLIKKLQSRNSEWTLPGGPDQYSLFFETSRVELAENELIFSYREHLNEKLIFRMNENRATPYNDLRLVVLYNDTLYMDFNSQETVEVAYKKFVKYHVLKNQGVTINPSEYGFEIPPTEEEDAQGVWMEEEQPLNAYPNLEYVEFKRRSKNYKIDLPDGTYSLAFDRNTTVSEFLDLIAFNCPSLVENVPRNEMSICSPDGSALWPDQSLWSFDQTEEESFQFKKQLHSLVIFLGEHAQKTLDVDYSLPVTKLLPQIWRSFTMAPKAENEFQIRRLSPDVALDLSKSLTAQGIPYNSTIIIKFIEIERSDSQLVDVNIWEEEESPATIMYDSENHHVRAGTLNKLVTMLTSEKNPDLDYMKGFLMTYLSFTVPQKLLNKLIERYYVPIPKSLSPEELEKWKKSTLRSIQLRVCNTLKHWLEHHWQDFDHELIQQVVNFVDTVASDGHSALAEQLRQAIVKRTCGLKTRSRTVGIKNGPESILRVSKKKDDGPLELLDFDELEIARQFTLIEFEYYEKIMPTELLGQAWSKQKTQHKSPNVLQMIAHSNDVSMFIATLILEPARVKLRAKRFDKLIKVAQHLRALNNFSSLMAFLAGFNNSAVSRLKFTKQLLPRRTLEILAELEAVMSVERSSMAYRTALHNSNPPCIPYLGTYLSDLTFIDEGNPDMLNGLINMGKRMLTYKVISEMQRYQLIGYQLRQVPAIAKYIKDIPSRDEKVYGQQLYEISMSREPRGAEKVL